MRSVINISLPEDLAKIVRNEAKTGNYASVSEYIRHLIRQQNRSKLLEELEEERKAFKAGKGKLLRSLKDLR